MVPIKPEKLSRAEEGTSLLAGFAAKRLRELKEKGKQFWEPGKGRKEERDAHEATFYHLAEYPTFKRLPEKFNSPETKRALNKKFAKFVEKIKAGEIDWRKYVPKRKSFGAPQKKGYEQ
ncbi:MAG: hypothetical protein NTY90_04710 [Candidatus Micrarchaeota archaeon]|nr:hypothetical protein [Candidatus Micrarchaeota archaeon]